METPPPSFSPAHLQSFEATLEAQIDFLEPYSGEIVRRWSELYLSAFSRRSFFSPERVKKIFSELVTLFIRCLKQKSLDFYFQNLSKKGSIFYNLGVPFEEVIISIHLFEEVCLSIFLRNYTDRSRLDQILTAVQELHSAGLTVLASSYFQSLQREFERSSESAREENEKLKREILDLKESFFKTTHDGFASMELLLSGVNKKLRNRVYRLNRIARTGERLEDQTDTNMLLMIARKQLLSDMPAHSEVLFGLFDENRKRINLYGRIDQMECKCGLLDDLYFSQLTAPCQNALAEQKRSLLITTLSDLPSGILAFPHLRGMREYLFLPIHQYDETIGFILVGCPQESFFAKNTIKWIERLARPIKQSLCCALLFNRLKRQTEFISALDELSNRTLLGQPIETTLNFCLDSIINILGVERCSLMLLDNASQELSVYAAKGYKVYPISSLRLKVGEGIAGWAVKEGRIVSIPKMREEHRQGGLLNKLFSNNSGFSKVKSFLCVPLMDNNKPLGAVNISTLTYYKRFQESEVAMIEQFSQRMVTTLKGLDLHHPASWTNRPVSVN